MAEKRMFAKTIIDSDAFLDMPQSTQNLYFHMAMRADDDGFINNPKKISRMVGAGDDDLKVLISKRFIIVFESGIVVIKHWKIHNYIAKDRYRATKYIEEFGQLQVNVNGSYTECIQPVYELSTQSSLGKVSLDKNSIEESKTDYTQTDLVIDYFNKITGKTMRYTTASRKPIHARLEEGFTVEECSKVIDIKYSCWFDDPDMQKFIRISTLFSPGHFETYLNEKVIKKKGAVNNRYVPEVVEITEEDRLKSEQFLKGGILKRGVNKSIDN